MPCDSDAGRFVARLEMLGMDTRTNAAMHMPDPKSERNAMIAATALEHGMTVVTRNAANFAETGAKLVDPFLAWSIRKN